MLTSTDLKQFFNEEDSFELNGKMIYLVPLKEFMKTEEFASFSPISRKDTNETTGETKITKCQFLNSSVWTDVYPHMIIDKTKSEKTIKYVDLSEKAVGGEFPNIEYEIMVQVNEDGSLNRDFVCVAEKEKRCTLSSKNKSKVAIERIFRPKTQL